MHATPQKGKIIVFGILFFYPLAGVTYQFLHYLLALRRLGYDPYYVEDPAFWVYDPTIDDMTPDPSRSISMVLPTLAAYGFGARWCFRGNYRDGRCYGLTESQLSQLYRDADAFLNVTGAQEIREEHLAVGRRIYVESDPFRMQVRVAQGDEDAIRQLTLHDTHFSFGENLGASDCEVPIERFQWLPTRQPVALDLWDNPFAPGDAYTTITTWSNAGRHTEYRGETYHWTKDREFVQVIDLPRRRPVPFEMAARVTDQVRALLHENGWRHIPAGEVSESADRYRAYIQRSRGEFTVAREQYARPYTGWFSDRSACYLAAGRPVITRETGFNKVLPTGKGLFGFRNMDDILAAVDAIESDYEGNCRVAREIAANYFAAEKVVGSVLHRAGM